MDSSGVAGKGEGRFCTAKDRVGGGSVRKYKGEIHK